jgi:hypothetical protein
LLLNALRGSLEDALNYEIVLNSDHLYYAEGAAAKIMPPMVLLLCISSLELRRWQMNLVILALFLDQAHHDGSGKFQRTRSMVTLADRQ